MPAPAVDTYRHVDHRWDDQVANSLDEVERLRYRSNILGDDQRITNTGGGNTSSKIMEKHPLTDEDTDVLWVKGSGGDLRTAKRANFASLEMDKLEGVRAVYDALEHKGAKTEGEDAMVGLYPHCTFNLNPRASSIDTPLHAFVPERHVDHMHPNAVIAVAAARNGEALTREIYGDDVAWLPWQRPGFDLGLQLAAVYHENPGLKGVVLGGHGLINWANDDRECYELTLSLIERAARFIEERDQGDKTFGGPRTKPLDETTRTEMLAELLPWLRGRLSTGRRVIGTVQHDDATMRFVDSVDAERLAELGTSCPDHFLRTKIKPMYIPFDPNAESLETLRARIDERLVGYREDYAAYYERCKRPDSPAMRDPNPTVILVPGLGMIAWGRNKSESRVTAEFYRCAIEVMRGAEAIDEYVAIPQQEAFDIEYWALEEAKLRRMPPEKALARHVVLVIGAGHGIGRTTALRVAADGAHVVCADLDASAAKATADALADEHGVGIGVSGSGLASCGPSLGLDVDITDRASVRSLLEQAVLAYGGIDDIVVTAGIYVPPDGTGHIDDAQWRRTFDVNVHGAYVVADEARRIWEAQGVTGSLVLTTSVNGVVPKAGSLAYDASKAAANHLVRELAIELAPNVRVNGVAPATVVAGSTMFPRDRVIASLTKYDLPFDDGESTETLRDRLADFYARRTLLRNPITPEDQAEAIRFLVGDEARRTTGQVVSVDGGLPEAFLR